MPYTGSYVPFESRGTTLYTSLPNVGEHTNLSSYYSEYDLYYLSADDFTVPSGEFWTIEEIRAYGEHVLNPGTPDPATKVDIYILAQNKS